MFHGSSPRIMDTLGFALSVDVAVSRTLVFFLRRRGIKRPWMLRGATGAAVTFILSELEARYIENWLLKICVWWGP